MHARRLRVQARNRLGRPLDLIGATYTVAFYIVTLAIRFWPVAVYPLRTFIPHTKEVLYTRTYALFLLSYLVYPRMGRVWKVSYHSSLAIVVRKKLLRWLRDRGFS